MIIARMHRANNIKFEIRAVLGRYEACSSNSLPTFRDTQLSQLQGLIIQILYIRLITFEDGTDRLSRNVGEESPLYAE